VTVNDSTESPRPWLLLIHQLPPKPDYLRVKTRRRLQRLGAIALKNTVYVLPYRAETLEDFEWLRAEIEADGGDATLCSATLVAGLSDDEVESLFRAEHDAEYAEIARAARAMTGGGKAAGSWTDVARMQRRLDELAKTDFFSAGGKVAAERAVGDLEAKLSAASAPTFSDVASRVAIRGRTWVTREDVFVDRMASAWLIRRRIDLAASFKFVPGKSYRPRPGEIRFDMFEAEYTHEGDRCTFETLLDRFGLGDDPVLQAIAEIVHDIDLKDEKFGRPEAPGIALALGGIRWAHEKDADRIHHSAAFFDSLNAQLGGGGV
jgi:hypothetical protein